MADNKVKGKSQNSSFKEKLEKARFFITEEIWQISLKNLPRHLSILIKVLRIIMLGVKKFMEDKVQLRASALTFYSLLSVVPIVAMVFGVAKGFGFDNLLRTQLEEQFQGQQEVLDYIMEFANNFIERTKGGLIAGIGLVILFWSVMKVMGNIESSLNDIWQIKKARNFARKFSDYISILLIAPLFIILSSSANVYVSTTLRSLANDHRIIEMIGPVVLFLLQFLPFVLIWALFTMVYMVMPNAKVNFSAAFIAGVIAGTSFQLVQWVYIYFQVGVSRYNAIYGSFAALPLFMIWLEVSWLIMLFGAEISFAYQNVGNYHHETDSLKISSRYKRLLTLLIVHKSLFRFLKRETPLTSEQISQNLDVPVKIVREILYQLVETKIFIETVTESPKENGYQIAMDPNSLTVELVLSSVEGLGNDNLEVHETSEIRKINDILNSFERVIKNSEANKLVKDI